jgi:hypothetical protein
MASYYMNPTGPLVKIRKILGQDIERLFLLVSDKSNQTIGVVKGLDRFRHNLYIGRG